MYASPPGLVLLLCDLCRPRSEGPAPAHGRTPNTPWEGGKRASCAGGPGHSVRSRRPTLARPADIRQPGPPGGTRAGSGPMERRAWVRWRCGYRPPGSSSWLLRRCRARRRCGRASPRAARRARLRPQADRPQPPRRARPGGQGRRLRRRARRGAGGGGRRAVGPRFLADGPCRRAEPSALPDRRDVSSRHEGAPRGAPVRRSRPDDHPDRARRSRGGRGDERAGARADDPGAIGRGGAAGRGPRPDRGSPT